MNKNKRKRLEARGWKVGDAKDFLGLSAEEQLIVEVRVALASSIRELRAKIGLTQDQLAKRLGSSQSRVAKMEAGDPSVAIDLLMRALFSLGRTRPQVASVIAR